MRIIEQLDEMTETARGWLTGGTVGFVPILSVFGLHDGHKTLVQAARESCEISIVSIPATPFPFVRNVPPSQYPRDLSRDLHFLSNTGVDAVFISHIQDLYPSEFSTYVNLTGPLAKRLEEMKGAIAVREFATLMTKLLLLVRPDVAYFGQKDAQQIAVIRQVVRDLNIDVRLSILPTVRESNGLAMSSRNLKLSWTERQAATIIYQSLLRSKAQIEKGERRARVIEQAIEECIITEPLVSLRYIAICHPDTFIPVSEIHPGTLLAIGAQVGNIHLADNILWARDGQWHT
jgi:pantoate--beta-alanine ligase